jgi:hypothetical protein
MSPETSDLSAVSYLFVGDASGLCPAGDSPDESRIFPSAETHVNLYISYILVNLSNIRFHENLFSGFQPGRWFIFLCNCEHSHNFYH